MNRPSKILAMLFFCHRLPERSFFFRGKQFPICARCTGILVGYILGIIYAIVFGKIPFLLIPLLLLPMAIDGGGQFINKWVSTNTRRFITGILAGVAVDFLLYEIGALGFKHGMEAARHFFN